MKDETHYGRIGLCFLACKRETKFLNFYPVLCCTEQMKEVWNINFCSVYAKNKLHICVLLWNTFHRIFRNSTPCKPMGVRYLKEIYQEIGGKRLTKRNKINMRFFDMLMWIKNYLKMISIIIGNFWLILKNIFITKIDHFAYNHMGVLVEMIYQYCFTTVSLFLYLSHPQFIAYH